MQTPLALLKCIAKASLNAVGGGFLGDVVVDVIPAVAGDVWKWWRPDRDEEAMRAELQALAQAPAEEVRQAAAEVAREVAGDRLPEVREELAVYLTQVPAMIRRSLRRPSDP